MSYWEGQRPWGRSVSGVALERCGSALRLVACGVLRPAITGSARSPVGENHQASPRTAAITTVRRLARPIFLADVSVVRKARRDSQGYKAAHRLELVTGGGALVARWGLKMSVQSFRCNHMPLRDQSFTASKPCTGSVPRQHAPQSGREGSRT